MVPATESPWTGVNMASLSVEPFVEPGSCLAGDICIRNPWPGIFQTIWGQSERLVDSSTRSIAGTRRAGTGATGPTSRVTALRGASHARGPAGTTFLATRCDAWIWRRSDDQPRVHHIPSGWHLVSSKRRPHPSR
jgi:hypothetical protein